MRDKPDSCFDSGCPLAEKGKGFALGTGDPTTAKYMVILEALGKEEPQFQLKPVEGRGFFETQASVDRELEIRRRDYPTLPERFIRYGAPIVGRTGSVFMFWLLPKVGLRREDWFIDNTLRCRPPQSKSGVQYPTGEARKAAEKCCRQYDRIAAFNPTTVVFSLHPSGLARECVPLPLVIKDFERVRDFTQYGRKVLLLLGGKATQAFARYGSNVTRWRAHYYHLATDWIDTYRSLFDYVAKGRKRKKMIDTDGERDDNTFFNVPESIQKRAREKRTRPEDVKVGLCKSSKRHTHTKPPKCGHGGCWDRYEEVQRE